MDLLEGLDNESYNASKSRLERERTRHRIVETNQNAREKPKSSFELREFRSFDKLLSHRQFELLGELILQQGCPELCWIPERYPNRGFVLHNLVRLGLSNVLKNVCTRQIAQQFEDQDWSNKVRDANKVRIGDYRLLLVEACYRQIPNMEVIRFLVEELGVDINSQHKYQKQSGSVIVENTALHQVAMGNYWWTVHEELPYFIGKGANLEVRNHHGETPLLVAVSESLDDPICFTHGTTQRIFYKGAIKTLLDAGADPNAEINFGYSCLSAAVTRMDIVELLVSYGAQVTPRAVFSAIERSQVESLEYFLARGNMANHRLSTIGGLNEYSDREEFLVRRSETYPLFDVAFK